MSIIDNLNVNLNGPLTPIAAVIIIFLLGVVLYRSSTSWGFYLRKRWPISFLRQAVESRKNIASILFIDDNDFPIVSSLKDDGFRVAKISDAKIDTQKVKTANIIFVDLNGVGTRISEEQQGIALINAIKSEYGHNKYVILYSAQNHNEPAKSRADAWLKKGTSYDKYIEAIQKACFALFA